MSGIKGMKMYPQGVREKILTEYKNGVSQCELSRRYSISAYKTTHSLLSKSNIYHSITQLSVELNQCGALYIINSAGIAYHQADINTHFV